MEITIVIRRGPHGLAKEIAAVAGTFTKVRDDAQKIEWKPEFTLAKGVSKTLWVWGMWPVRIKNVDGKHYFTTPLFSGGIWTHEVEDPGDVATITGRDVRVAVL